jgi:hypothetical protein
MMPAEYAATAFALLDGGRLIAYLPPIDFRASAERTQHRSRESRVSRRRARRIDRAAVAALALNAAVCLAVASLLAF